MLLEFKPTGNYFKVVSEIQVINLPIQDWHWGAPHKG